MVEIVENHIRMHAINPARKPDASRHLQLN